MPVATLTRMTLFALLLLGSALVGLGALARKRRRTTAATA